MNKIEDSAVPAIRDAQDVTTLSKSEKQLEIEDKLQNGSQADQIQYLLDAVVIDERETQRDSDCDRDHGMRLFARQKNRHPVVILVTLFILTLVYGLQLVALYNLNNY